MRKVLVKTLAASFALALALTLSCSDDKDEGGSDPDNGGGGSASFCELSGGGVPVCLEMPSNECSKDFYSSYPGGWKGFTYTKVDKCTKETPDAVYYAGKNDDGTNNCATGVSKSYCETILKLAATSIFKTIKECIDFKPPLCRVNDYCAPTAKGEESCIKAGGTIVPSCD